MNVSVAGIYCFRGLFCEDLGFGRIFLGVVVSCISGPTPSIEGGLKVNLKPPLKPPLKVLALDLKA